MYRVFALLYLLFFILCSVFAGRFFTGKKEGKDVRADKMMAFYSFALFVLFFYLTGVSNPSSKEKIVENNTKDNESQISVSSNTEITTKIDSSSEASTVKITESNLNNSKPEDEQTEPGIENIVANEATTNDITTTALSKDFYDDLEEIPYYDILVNLDKYIDTTVKTTVKVETCYDLTDYKNAKGKTQFYVNSIKLASYNYVGGSIYLDEAVSVEDGSYATVVFRIQLNDYKSEEFVNGVLIDASAQAQQTYEEDYKLFVQHFKDEAEEVTYDTLLRYPDTYTGKKVKVKVEIKIAEPDGVIFQGDLIGVFSGTSKEVNFYDCRVLREPRLQVGDVVTVYGFGDGLMTMKEVEWSGLVPHTKREYDIPSISLWFVEF